ncbi:MAG: helix-turn-helix transcriptional regulator [Burkholderiales bacterium]|nr:helix-turn-helix transcriptional regulator [Burkholderiales bacterium]
MPRTDFGQMNCAIAQALELIGEGWSILIIREAFYGTRRFGDFEARLGIARNILSTRLNKLTAGGILRRVPGQGGSKYQEYELTDMGQALGPALLAIGLWGSKWIAGEGKSAEEMLNIVRQERALRAGVQPSAAALSRKRRPA